MTLSEDDLTVALGLLAEEVARAELSLTGQRRGELTALRDRLINDLGNHVARARDLDAPLLVVLGGVTGAGKSTVTNSLAGRQLVATGAVRPTTIQPTLLCSPDDLAWFTGPRVLTGLTRQVVDARELDTAPSSPGALRVIPLPEQPTGLALLDAPDIDSVATANRQLADKLLDAADLWLWFTTVGKYADAESMAYLARANRRGTALVVVLTQVRDADRQAVVEDFSLKLAGAGVTRSALVVIPWVDGVRGLLPEHATADLGQWMARLADPDERRRRRRQTLEGAIAALDVDLAPLVEATEHELTVARRLLAQIEASYDDAVDTFARTVGEGLPLRGEILGRWTDYVGSTRMLELTGRMTSQAKRWVTDLLRGSSSASERRLEREVRVEVADTVTDTMTRLADLAATQAVDGWQQTDEGRVLISDSGTLRGHSADLPDRCLDAVRAWQGAVVDLVAEQGVNRRSRARWMSTVINALATGAIVVALASTGGLTGAEAGIATAASAANQALLVTALGERTVRWLVSRSREDLVRRFAEVLVPERRRLSGVVAAAAPDPDLPDALRTRLAEVRA